MDQNAFVAACKELGLSLSDTQLQAFAEFEEALYRSNEVMNLTRVPIEECWLRHFIDSLLFQDLIPVKSKVLDIGSGPGFPAWPLACARPDLEITALDSAGKFTTFLKRQSLPNLKVVTGRAEDWGVLELFTVVTGRALAPLAVQIELSAPPCRIDGLVIPMRTFSDEPNLENCGASRVGLQLKTAIVRELPGTGAMRLFPIYEKKEHAPTKYPRSWTEIKKSPLTGP